MEVLIGIMALAIFGFGSVCAAFLVLVQPIWGIVDVATSVRHSGGTKAAVILLTLLLLGPLMTILYAIFSSHSRLLRFTTILAGVFLLISAGSFFALAAVYPDAKNRIRSLTGRAEREVSESAGSIAEEDRLPTISVHDVTIDPFRAVYNVPANGRDVAVSLAEFDLSGVDGETARPVTVPSIYPLRQIAIDPRGPRTYGITTHKVGWIVPATGVFVEIEQDPALTISWPSAIAFDTRSSRVIVTARNGGFSFDPETGAWARGTGFDRPLLALAFDEESDSFFGLEEAPGATQVSFLSRFNRDGALISSVPLSQPLSLESLREGRAQLIDRERWLVLLVSAHRSLPDGTDGFVEARVYLIDPSSGSLSRVRSEA